MCRSDRRLCLAAVVERSGSIALPQGKLVVHEWGTFTGFAGSDGVHLPFNTIVGSDLPAFVVNRQRQAIRQDPKLQMPLAFVKGGGVAALQRMETPVVFFYADAPLQINARVDFPEGTLTEFYPPVLNIGPRFGAGFGESVAVLPPGAGAQTRPAASFLDWGNVRIVPNPTGNEGMLIPEVADGSRYSFARNTDAAIVQFADADGKRHEEKFLFYRGLGNFTLPVTLVAEGGNRFEVRNVAASPIPSAFLIQIDGDVRKTLRYARFENIVANQQLMLAAAKASPEELSEAITKSLIAYGLYEKEARAMVATWKSTWLDEPGTRLLYTLPRPVTDALLPLHLTPTPDQTVRVLVGRIDILTPELEARLGSMMRTANATTNLTSEDARILHDLDRFLAPALERVGKLTGDVDRSQRGRLYEAFYRLQATR